MKAPAPPCAAQIAIDILFRPRAQLEAVRIDYIVVFDHLTVVTATSISIGIKMGSGNAGLKILTLGKSAELKDEKVEILTV